MHKKLSESPCDKYKAINGEFNQANYLIGAKGKISENKIKR